MSNLKFSVILPTYNRLQFIDLAVESILKQTYKNYEIIVVDDGSTDGTAEFLIQKYGQKISVYSITNSERGYARNHGAANSSGDYLLFFDSDDLMDVNHLETAAKYLQEDTKIDLLQVGYRFIDSNNHVLKPNITATIKNNKAKYLNGNPFSIDAMFVKRTAFEAVKFVENRNGAGSEDYLLWLQLLARHDVTIKKDVTCSMVEHEDRSMNTLMADSLIKRIDVILETLNNDQHFLKTFGKSGINQVHGSYLTYLGITYVNMNQKALGWKTYFKGILKSPIKIFSRTTLAMVKNTFK